MKETALWVALGALFFIPFIPLFVSGDFFFPYITSKGFAFRILAEIAVGAWLILAFADKRYRPQFSLPLVLFFALVVWMGVADLLAVNPHKAFWSNFERMDGWVTLIHVFGFFLVAGSVLSVKNLWKSWWLTFISASAVVVGIGLLQLWGVMDTGQGGARVDSTFGNASYLAAYLLFASAVTLWHALESKGWLRWLLFALVPFQAIIIFATATRGAMLGFLAAAVLAAVLFLFEKGNKRVKTIAVGALAGVVVLVGGFMLIKDTSFVQNDPTLTRIASISLESGTTRFTIWGMAFEGFLARPVTGWGHEGFNYVFNTYYRPSLYGQEPWFDRAHNMFLDWLLSGGAPALLLFVALLACVAVILYRRETSAAERVFLIAGLAAYSFQGLFVFDNLFTYVPLAAFLATAHASASRPLRFFDRMPEVGSSTVSSVVTPVVAVFLIGTVYIVNMPGMSASGHIIQALRQVNTGSVELMQSYFKRALDTKSFGTQEIREQMIMQIPIVLSRTDVPDSQKAAFYEFAMSEMEKEVAAVPKDARLRLQYATGFQAAGDFVNALREISVAEELSPTKQQVILQRGLVLWQAGDRAGANEAFAAAYELDPTFVGPVTYAAAGSYLVGDVARAQQILQDHYGTTVVDNQVLIYAYYDAQRYDDIIAVYRLRVSASLGAPSDRFELAKVLATLGRIGEARAEIEATIRDNPSAAAEGASLLRALQ